MNRFTPRFCSLAMLCAIAMSHDVRADAHWISDSHAVSADSQRTPVSLQLRRELTLPAKPRVFRVRVSADNRFVLYVNQRRVGAGPARGNLDHWRFEVFDLAPFLEKGVNVIAAQVWNDAAAAPLAQISSGHTGFWLSADDAGQSALVDTNTGWQVRVDTSRSVEPGMAQIRQALGQGFYAAGPAETIDAAQHLANWADRATQAEGWQPATLIDAHSSTWKLVPDSLPPMRFERVPTGRVARASGVTADGFPGRSISIPAHSEARILLDAGRVLAAYPVLVLSGGAGAQVKVTYVEALYDAKVTLNDPQAPRRARFSDRATVQDGLALGLTDTFEPDGAAHRRLHPFWWRAWRFAEITVRTASAPLTLDDFETWETGYPFKQQGRFISSDAELNALWRVGWRTAQLDAHETYMDTAYWEQLQYIGDTRIQMLISYAVAGDPRLAIQALEVVDHSRVVAGLPQSAWPGVLKQVIPPFALLWIGSLHDYWMYQPDTAVLQRTLNGTRAVLDEFAGYVQPSGLVRLTTGWPFVDWRPGLDGWAYRDKPLVSCIVTMQYVGALSEAADLEQALGDPKRVERYRSAAARVREGLNKECWSADRGLYADTPEKNQFSQHGAVLAVLYDIAPPDRRKALLEKVTLPTGGIDAPNGITSPSYYFSFYLARALDHAGLTDRYLDLLQPWRAMLQRNFTTWPETPDPSRSDTHAWSAHPTVGLMTYVAGIKPDAPGYARVRIEPHLGTLTTLDAAVAHPRGLIETKYSLRGKSLAATITLPEGLAGTFAWKGQTRELSPGKNQITLTE
jgi:hypothetical protein